MGEVVLWVVAARGCLPLWLLGMASGSSYGVADFNPSGVYRISDSGNELFVLGCDALAFINSRRLGYGCLYCAGCVVSCEDSGRACGGACAGCHGDILPGPTDNSMYFTDDEVSLAWKHRAKDREVPS